jgi:hypothetical protein
MRIAVTGELAKTSAPGPYEEWLLRFTPTIQFVELTRKGIRTDRVETRDGLLLTGGDVHPALWCAGRRYVYQGCR